MAVNDNSMLNSPNRLELMRVTERTHQMGAQFHMYVRNRMTSVKEFPAHKIVTWNKIRDWIESNYKWLSEHRFEWSELDHVGQPHIHYGIHLNGGVTIFRSDSTQKIQVIFDYDSDKQILHEFTNLVNDLEHKPKNRVGLIQMSYGTLNVKFVEYRPYELEITPFLGEEIIDLKQEMLRSFRGESGSGLFLIYGKPGTGKTSFLKEILNQTDKQALFIPPSIAGELGNPNLISLLMDHSNSILIIEDAETVLMKREADNSDAVSNLLNLTDGFPSDFLKLNIICTFNTNLDDIDPALLRKGRLKGIHEFTKLSIPKAIKLANHLGKEIEITQPMTLAEVCNAGILDRKVAGNWIGF